MAPSMGVVKLRTKSSLIQIARAKSSAKLFELNASGGTTRNSKLIVVNNKSRATRARIRLCNRAQSVYSNC